MQDEEINICSWGDLNTMNEIIYSNLHFLNTEGRFVSVLNDKK